MPTPAHGMRGSKQRLSNSVTKGLSVVIATTDPKNPKCGVLCEATLDKPRSRGQIALLGSLACTDQPETRLSFHANLWCCCEAQPPRNHEHVEPVGHRWCSLQQTGLWCSPKRRQVRAVQPLEELFRQMMNAARSPIKQRAQSRFLDGQHKLLAWWQGRRMTIPGTELISCGRYKAFHA